MKRLLYTALIGTALIATAACSTVDEPLHALVVEGYMADGEYPVVCLMQTVSPEQTGNTMADMVVRWGRVVLSDGSDSIILTGGPDKRYFPPYTYTTFEMQGHTGRSYTLAADYGDMRAKARCTIPEAVPIDSIVATAVSAKERQLMLYLTASPDSNQYFRVLARVRGVHSRLLPAFMGVAESGGKGGTLAIGVNRPKTINDTTDFVPTFSVGEEVEIALCHISREAYRFWLDYENMVAFSGSQFLAPSTPLSSNVQGGFGYFFGYGITRRLITIR